MESTILALSSRYDEVSNPSTDKQEYSNDEGSGAKPRRNDDREGYEPAGDKPDGI